MHEPKTLKAHLKTLGWTNIDLAAHWGHSVDYISWLVNNPHDRPKVYGDAFRGLRERKDVEVVRQVRHKTRGRRKPEYWTHDEQYAPGKRFITDGGVVILQADDRDKPLRLDDEMVLVVVNVGKATVKRKPPSSGDWRDLLGSGNQRPQVGGSQTLEVSVVNFVLADSGDQICIESGPELLKLLDAGEEWQ